MNTLAQRLDDVLSCLYDYEYIDIERFYNDKNKQEALGVLESAISRGHTKREEMEILQELHDDLDKFIQFETNYNSRLGDF